jgi:photosystem II stability/assembly factor-like uncharacterized protein
MKTINLLSLLLFVSLSGFAQWGQVNTGILNLTFGAKLLGSSDTYLFSGTLGGAKMYRTSNNGNNWEEITPPTLGNVPECGHYFDSKYFAGLNSSQECIFYTNDDGSSWNNVTGGPQTTWVRGFISLPGNIFAYTSTAGIYKSSNGSDWESANDGLGNLNVIWMETINAKLIAATIGGGVFVSSDNGETWVQSNNGIAGDALNATLVWRMGSGLYYMEQGGTSYSSADEGTTWSAWTKPAVMGLAVTEIFRKNNNLYMESRHFAGGLRDSVYLSTDEGITWANITDNLSATDLSASGITEFNGYAFIAYNLISPEMGIYRRGISTGINTEYASDQAIIFPNPFSEKIAFSNKSDQEIKQIYIFDSLGKLVLSETGGNTIHTAGLHDGIYIVKLVFTDNTTMQRKLVKERTSR